MEETRKKERDRNRASILGSIKIFMFVVTTKTILL